MTNVGYMKILILPLSRFIGHERIFYVLDNLTNETCVYATKSISLDFYSNEVYRHTFGGIQHVEDLKTCAHPTNPDEGSTDYSCYKKKKVKQMMYFMERDQSLQLTDAWSLTLPMPKFEYMQHCHDLHYHKDCEYTVLYYKAFHQAFLFRC